MLFLDLLNTERGLLDPMFDRGMTDVGRNIVRLLRR
jgi:hypothetical protein